MNVSPDYENMTDNNFSTYGRAQFYKNDKVAKIEVKLDEYYNFSSISIYGDKHYNYSYGSFNGFTVYAGSTLCGACSNYTVCRTYCTSRPVANKVVIKKNLPENHNYSSVLIYEVEISGQEFHGHMGLSAGAIGGIAAGVCCATLLLLAGGKRCANRIKEKTRFIKELCDGYAVASSRGAGSRQFEIQHHHPDKKVKHTLYLRRGCEDTGPRHAVNFVINVDGSAEREKIMVKFTETRDADNVNVGEETETRFHEAADEGVELALGICDIDVQNDVSSFDEVIANNVASPVLTMDFFDSD